ncbi:hypothetical protein M0805_005221 [Coniferiporia weirii]|nr:hypothetical protein M0805_005221 [Coniferiporia weirii]
MKLSVLGPRRAAAGKLPSSNLKSLKACCRPYHDESFGFRRRREVVLPDYTASQLQNRTTHAPLLRYVDSMRTHGHRAARIDPLDLLQREEVAALDPTRYGLTDPKQTYPVDGIVWTNPAGPNTTSTETWPLERITAHLRAVYVGNIAYEFMHSPSKTERLWFSHVLESTAVAPRNVRRAEEKRRMWSLMTRSEVFDQYLQLKFPNLKRYGLEGGESMLPALDTLFSVASAAGIEHIILAMPHRGRLNLLTDLLEMSPSKLFHKVKGGSEIPEELGYSGDVISHLVASPTLRYGSPALPLKVSLLPNPSHLEAADPVALGKTRAKQFALIKEADPECKLGDKVMCVQLHGDASFTGQGVVMESLGLSNLPHFTSGGSVHLVVNNNIGYTTPASSARSSLYCSDIGKMINAPVLHVNGDHPEDVSRALDTAFQYRNAFRKDIVVDLLVYRRWGHNELDEPAFTQPLMYQNIRTRKSVPTLYEDKLLFEYGMSWESPKLLPIWEAQFGDFFNGAQVIFDTFISSAETKWLTQSGIVILLPHGLDGAGPEHSSMRIERMLQLTNDTFDFHDGSGARHINMHVVYPTTPAQYFHLLRRQMKRNYRRPLVVAAPKGLLRLAAAASSSSDLEPNTRFQPVLDDKMITDASSAERVILLSGKIYYDLMKERAARGLENKVALIRVEELSPFPFQALSEALQRYTRAAEVCWLQEEPRNQGAWTHVEPRIGSVLEKVGGHAEGRDRKALRYIGRKEDAVPAVGVGKVYKEQQNSVLQAAFDGLD